MEKTDIVISEDLRWLRHVLNSELEEPSISDWQQLLSFAEKQAIIGICLPEKCPDNLDKGLLFQWIGSVHLIENQNKLLNRRVEQLFGKLEKDGFECCLLKGQGNAEIYPNPLRRCPGDIDVWINADEDAIYQYVKKIFPDAEVSYKHIHFPIFEDVPVDVHVTPLKFYSGLYQRRLQRWIEKNKEEQFEHRIKLSETNRDISAPTPLFNAVYQLGHMLIHLFDEGLGLRQVVDYYYVLKGLEASDKDLQELVGSIYSLGMYKFASAVMWIEKGVLGLPVELCFVEPDERRGKQLLKDILKGGNFGHYSKRHKGRTCFYYRGFVEAWRLVKLLPISPWEGSARLMSKMRTAVMHVLKKKCNYNLK